MKRQVIGMKERINRLAKGIIDSEQPKMTWSPEKIDETLRMNTLMQRNLWIGSENGLSVKGFVYSSNLRVRIPGDNNSFGGLRCRIVYEVDTSFLTAGDTITGSFYLVTNCGEEEIPYEFHVEVADAGKTLGDLKTAEDFCTSRKMIWRRRSGFWSTRILWKCRLCRICMCGHSMTA